MKEYIEREALIARYDAEHVGPPGRARELMVTAPAADVVEVVRCKDCENSRPLKRERLPESIFRKECVWCRRFNTGKLPDSYCDDGERKEEWPCRTLF